MIAEVEPGGLEWDDDRPVMLNRHGLLHVSRPLPPPPWTAQQMLTFQWRTVCGRVHQNIRVARVFMPDRMPRWCAVCTDRRSR